MEIVVWLVIRLFLVLKIRLRLLSGLSFMINLFRL